MSNAFPYLEENERFSFPPPETATREGIVGVGGNLSPGMLLSAYRQGVFPWFSEGEPILWWSPDPRFVLFPDELHVSKTMQKVLRTTALVVRLDTRFRDVIRACSEMPREGQDGTWITDEMIDAYSELHDLGYAHSVEVLDGRTLVGGLYGVLIGTCFFGESMFARVSNASKVGFVTLVRELGARGMLSLVDCQVHTHHLESLGAKAVPRRRFLKILSEGVSNETPRGNLESILEFST